MFHRTDDFDRVDGGEAGVEEERATQASATITKNAAHLKKYFLQNIYSQFHHYPAPYRLQMFDSPHQSRHYLQVLCLSHIAEDKLADGADEQGQNDPVSAQPGLV